MDSSLHPHHRNVMLFTAMAKIHGHGVDSALHLHDRSRMLFTAMGKFTCTVWTVHCIRTTQVECYSLPWANSRARCGQFSAPTKHKKETRVSLPEQSYSHGLDSSLHPQTTRNTVFTA